MPGPARSPRPGFTITESLVALTLFAVGLLATAGTAAAIQRLSAAGRLHGNAARLASSRLEELRGTECAARAAGTAVTRGITERWTISSAPGVTLASDSLLLPTGRDRPPREIGLSAAFPC